MITTIVAGDAKTMRVFYYHYNKPASKKAGRVQWSVHHRGICHIVDAVECFQPTMTKVRNSQPVAVVHGRCKNVQMTIVGGLVCAVIL